MKKFLTYLFVFFGFLFVLEIGALAYVWFADPFHIRPLISAVTAKTDNTTPTDVPAQTATTPAVDKNPALSPIQEQALEKIGVDPAKLHTTITPEMRACFVEKLGGARVQEIQSGSTPTAVELLTTRSCYQ